jgi:hypothetical protein
MRLSEIAHRFTNVKGRKRIMKQHSVLLGIALVAIATCGSSPETAAQQAPPPTNTTNYYDGQYVGNLTVITPPAGGNISQCPNVTVAPALTIKDGLAKFSVSDIVLQGYVTTDGFVYMRAPSGQTFVGQFDPYYNLKGRVTGKCFYDATWEKYTKRP